MISGIGAQERVREERWVFHRKRARKDFGVSPVCSTGLRRLRQEGEREGRSDPFFTCASVREHEGARAKRNHQGNMFQPRPPAQRFRSAPPAG
jgi:hypothetical protein